MKHLGKLPRKWLGWGVFVAVLAALVATVPLTLKPQDSVVLAVMPHPDDEFQFWSVIEDRPDEYKIFVSLTRGEETRFCETERLEQSLQEELGEIPPNPVPRGRATASCQEAQANSLLGFLTEMSRTDRTIPGNFGVREDVDAGEAEGGSFGDEVWLWRDLDDRGAVLMFDLGDGQLTEATVRWAIERVLAQRETWNLAPTVPVRSIVGAFSNYESDLCYTYPHVDHLAVEQALYNHDFGVGPQLGATCLRDPRRSFTAVVSASSIKAAFERGVEGQRIGAHTRHYGWLHNDAYPLAKWRQSSLFHRVQSFWVRFP